ncbi:hypothetical protein ScPMuIL_006759 [Solemya velum]
MYYVNHNGKRVCLDATKISNRLGRLVNDSVDKSNAKMRKFIIDGKVHLALFAKMTINIGDEILYNYGDNNAWWRKPSRSKVIVKSCAIDLMKRGRKEFFADSDGKTVKFVDDSDGKRVELVDDNDEKRVELVDNNDGKMVELVNDSDGKMVELVNDSDGKRVELDSDGKRVELDSDGKRVELVNNSDGKMVELVDYSDGKRVEFGDDSDGKRVEFVDSDGKMVELVDDNDGKMVELGDDSDEKRVELVDSDAKMVELVDDNDGNFVKLVDDSDRKSVELVDDSDGKRVELVDDSDGKRVEFVDSDGKRVELVDENDGKMVELGDNSDEKRVELVDSDAKMVELVDDNDGNLVKLVDDSDGKMVELDSDGKREELVDNSDGKMVKLGNSSDGKMVELVDDNDGKRVELVDNRDGKMVELDSDGKRVEFVDSDEQMVHMTDDKESNQGLISKYLRQQSKKEYCFVTNDDLSGNDTDKDYVPDSDDDESDCSSMSGVYPLLNKGVDCKEYMYEEAKTTGKTENITPNDTQKGVDCKEYMYEEAKTTGKTEKITPNDTQKDKISISFTRNYDGKRVWDKKNSCYYCSKLETNIGRHLKRKHNKEHMVAKALSFGKKSKERFKELDRIRHLGNFYHNSKVFVLNEGTILVAKRPSKDASLAAGDYALFCKGYYVATELWRHHKECKFKDKVDDDDEFEHLQKGGLRSSRMLRTSISQEGGMDHTLGKLLVQ